MIVESRSNDILDRVQLIALCIAAMLGDAAEIDLHGRVGMGIACRIGAAAAVDVVGSSATLDDVVAVVADDPVTKSRADDIFKIYYLGDLQRQGQRAAKVFVNLAVRKVDGKRSIGVAVVEDIFALAAIEEIHRLIDGQDECVV